MIRIETSCQNFGALCFVLDKFSTNSKYWKAQNKYLCLFVELIRAPLESHLSRHGRKVPHAADDGPAAHHTQQVVHHSKLAAIPEGISKSGIIL